MFILNYYDIMHVFNYKLCL